MFTKKALLTKWGLYALALLLLTLVQEFFLDGLTPYIGLAPFLMPMTVAVVAALEGAVPGAIFGVAVGILCDLDGGGVFAGVYTLSFACIALCIALISKTWVMRNAFGSLIYALLAFCVLDLIQAAYLMLLQGASFAAIFDLAWREIAVSILLVLPIFSFSIFSTVFSAMNEQGACHGLFF